MLETYWPAANGWPLAGWRVGWPAARIEVVVTGVLGRDHRVPAEDLVLAGREYWIAGGALDTLRDSQSSSTPQPNSANCPFRPLASRRKRGLTTVGVGG